MSKEKKETKYVMAGTDEEVLLGDVISQKLVKELEDGRSITREIEFAITEDSLPFALDLGIIEEAETEEDEDSEDYDEEDLESMVEDHEQMLEELMGLNENLEKRIEKLEEKASTFEHLLNKNKGKKTCGTEKK